MSELSTLSFLKPEQGPTRPLSLTILVIFASLLCLSLFVGIGWGLRNVVVNHWANVSAPELALFFLVRLLGFSLCIAFLYAFARKYQAARWFALTLLLVLTVYEIYFTLFVPSEQRVVNLPRFAYNNPAFGLTVERVTGACLMLAWTWHVAFAKKSKLYFSSWRPSDEARDELPSISTTNSVNR